MLNTLVLEYGKFSPQDIISTKLQLQGKAKIGPIFPIFFIPIFSYIILNSYIFLYFWKTINFTRFM